MAHRANLCATLCHCQRIVRIVPMYRNDWTNMLCNFSKFTKAYSNALRSAEGHATYSTGVGQPNFSAAASNFLISISRMKKVDCLWNTHENSTPFMSAHVLVWTVSRNVTRLRGCAVSCFEEDVCFTEVTYSCKDLYVFKESLVMESVCLIRFMAPSLCLCIRRRVI